MYRLYRVGDHIYPCLTPLSLLTLSLSRLPDVYLAPHNAPYLTTQPNPPQDFTQHFPIYLVIFFLYIRKTKVKIVSILTSLNCFIHNKYMLSSGVLATRKPFCSSSSTLNLHLVLSFSATLNTALCP